LEEEVDADCIGCGGKFFFTMMAAFAELERDIIHERTKVATRLNGVAARRGPCSREGAGAERGAEPSGRAA
jgi:DNA invertase Pin-like site-specific DNA recombinase